MENLTELPTPEQASLLLLSEDCLLELFDFLKFKDSMNLAETCIYLCAVANRTFRKYSTMQLDRKMAENGKECIDRFFTHFGHRVLSLVISSPWDKLDCWRIVRNCENLKRLKMYGICGDFENGPPLFTIDNLEVLSFVQCDEEFIKSLINIVRKINALSIRWCQMECNALKKVFRSSPDMESFEWSGRYRFDFHFLEIISNVERLSLGANLTNVSELDALLKLNRLSKLALRCIRTNITSFLCELAKKEIIEELEVQLLNVAFDKNFFEMLKSFDTLQLLVLCADYDFRNELKPTIVWPPKLKRFQLRFFVFTLDAVLSAIKQLKYLESICINDCWIVEGEADNFDDVKELSQQILAAIGDDCDRKQRLDVVLPRELKFVEGSSEKFLCDSERLRIYNKSPPDFSLSFPGIEL